ncbi:MAG: choice-of-anchor D domain-containing protein, partial [Bacteroidota bacterium]
MKNLENKQLRMTRIGLGIFLIGSLLSTSLVWAQPATPTQSAKPKKVITPVRADKSPTLRDIARTFKSTKPSGKPREIPLRPSPLKDKYRETGFLGPDPAWQDSQGNFRPAATISSFEGLSDDDNEIINGFRVVPPDPNGDVGPNHYVQMINLLFAVYDKAGNTLLGPLPNNALWTGFGGPCEFDNNGDPIVLYDPLADRWLLTQFAVSSGLSECVACSETSDPTGAYFRYEFPFADFPDYPKLGVWPDAYYATFRVFGDNTFDMVAAALERDSILVGNPAQIVLFSITDALAPTDIDGVLPVDLDGSPPPVGTPGLFLGHQDDAFTGAPEDRLVLFELSVDWNNPANSTFDGPFFLPTDPFDASVFLVPQPFTNQGLDALPFFTMHRLAFRDFGTHMAMVANHTVDIGDFDDHAGIRWYELRNDGSGWSIFQQGTYAPDSDHRWMGSIAMDADGNIALGYSVSGDHTFPSIRYTGRTSDAPLGAMNVVEQSVFEGTGAQTGNSRWGDYSMLAVDPADEATFWYTNEYYAETSSFNFRTRIGSFNLEPLTNPQIQVLRSSIDFGLVILGETAGPVTVTISNIGDADLMVTDISDPGAPFSLSNVPALPVTIPSFGSESFDVTFSPTAEDSVSTTIFISSNDADNPTVDVALSGDGLDITDVEALVWNPTAVFTAQQVVAQAAKAKGKAKEITAQGARALLNNQMLSADSIAAALDANGISNKTLPRTTLPTSIPPNIQYLFVVLGQFPANFVVSNGSAEATTIEDFIANGGKVYMEGGDVWFYDPQFAGGHDFGPTFGISAVDDGAGDG